MSETKSIKKQLRMEALARAISGGKIDLTIVLTQLVKLYRDGEPVRMSKRAGEFVVRTVGVEFVAEESGQFASPIDEERSVLDSDVRAGEALGQVVAVTAILKEIAQPPLDPLFFGYFLQRADFFQ